MITKIFTLSFLSYYLLFMILITTGFSGCGKRIEQVSLYVAVNGDDLNQGTIKQPLKTLTGARNRIRELRGKGDRNDITVYLREGYYLQRETFHLGIEDGTNGEYTTIYSSYPGESPVIGSGLPVEGWRKPESIPEFLPENAHSKIWEADLPEGIGFFSTMYSDDKRLPQAISKGVLATSRHTDMDDKDITDPLSYMKYPEKMMRNWKNTSDIEIVIIPNFPWTMNNLRLEWVNEEKGICKTQLRASYPLRQTPRGRLMDPNLWIQNAVDYLDEPGEWIVNTKERKIYYWPIKDDQPGNEVRIPLLRELVHVGGKTCVLESMDEPVKGIVFKDLTFMHADRDLWTENDRGIQHDWLMEDKPDALLRFRAAENCMVKNCCFTNSGGNAIRLDFHCQNISISGNEISFLGQGGINLIGYGPGTKDVNKNNTIINNHIHHIGELYWHSHAVVLWQSGNNLVSNNFIHDVPRKAFCLSGVRFKYVTEKHRSLPLDQKKPREYWRTIRWSELKEYPDTLDELLPYLHTRNNIIENNEIRNATMKLGDGSAINVSGAGENNIIRHNLLYDITNTNACSVLRTDDYQDGTIMENNIVYRCYLRAVCLKGENIFRNNFFIDVGAPDQKSRYVYSISTLEGPMKKARSEKNIYVVNNPVNGFWKFINDDMTAYKDCYFDDNIYHLPTKETVFADMERMMNAGFDQHSLFEDPMFIDTDNWNFNFKPNSPALELGIQPISLDNIGLAGDFPERFDADAGFRGEQTNGY